MTDHQMTDYRDELLDTDKILNERLWSGRATEHAIIEWLDNFRSGVVDEDRLHALYLLAHFMYFDDRETRELLRSMYRDLYRYPIVAAIRSRLGDTLDVDQIHNEFLRERQQTRFLPLGNPAESSAHLLYFFRQENELPKRLFANTHELFSRRIDDPAVGLRHPEVRRFVFVDDLCGSGSQALDYSKTVLPALQMIAARDGLSLHFSYHALFATAHGLREVEDHGLFNQVAAVNVIDESYKVFGPESRYFQACPPFITHLAAEAMCRLYGSRLEPSDPLGYRDSQLLLGFRHNVPDNTLPIFWSEGVAGTPWTPMFRRYKKIYG